MVRKEQQKKDLGEDSNGNQFVAKNTFIFLHIDLNIFLGAPKNCLIETVLWFFKRVCLWM